MTRARVAAILFRMRRLFALAVVGLALAAVWNLLAGGLGAPGPGPGSGVPDAAEPGAAVRGEEVGGERSPAPDTGVAAELPDAFTSTPEDGEPSVDPVRDGVVVVVVDPEGRPVADLGIEVTWRKGYGDYGVDRGRTDAGGGFATTVREVAMIEDVDGTDPRSGVSLDAASPPDPRDAVGRRVFVQLPVWRDVAVSVRDLDGAPVSGVEVVFDRTSAFPREPGTCVLGLPEARGVTGEDGALRLELPEGIFEVDVDGVRALADWRLCVDPASGPIEVVLRVARAENGRAVRVRVVRPAGVEDVPVVTITNRGAPPPLPGEDARALVAVPDARARRGERVEGDVFVVRGVEPGDATLYVRCDGCEPWTQAVPPEVTETVAVLRAAEPEPPPRTVRGVVVDESGAPVSTARVGLCRDARIAHARFVQADGDGRFEVEVGTRGPYVLIARASGRALAMVGPFDGTVDPSPVRIEMAPERVVEGRVLDFEGRPVADANVWMYRERGPLRVFDPDAASPFLPESSTDDMGVIWPDGRFRIDEVGEGRVEIRAVPYEGSPFGIGRAVGPAGETVDVVLGRGFEDSVAVVGRVLDANSGAPIAGATVKLRPASGPGASEGYGEASADAGGRFRCVGPSAGRAVVVVEAAGYPTMAFPPRELGPGDNEVELEVPSALRLSLRLIDVRGVPVGGVEIGIDDGAGGLLALQDRLGRYDGASARTDLRGRVDLFGVPRARVRVVVGDVEGTGEVDLPIRGSISPGRHVFHLDLRAHPGGLLTLTVP